MPYKNIDFELVDLKKLQATNDVKFSYLFQVACELKLHWDAVGEPYLPYIPRRLLMRIFLLPKVRPNRMIALM